MDLVGFCFHWKWYVCVEGWKKGKKERKKKGRKSKEEGRKERKKSKEERKEGRKKGRKRKEERKKGRKSKEGKRKGRKKWKNRKTFKIDIFQTGKSDPTSFRTLCTFKTTRRPPRRAFCWRAGSSIWTLNSSCAIRTSFSGRLATTKYIFDTFSKLYIMYVSNLQWKNLYVFQRLFKQSMRVESTLANPCTIWRRCKMVQKLTRYTNILYLNL